jgi:hypothetical protein
MKYSVENSVYGAIDGAVTTASDVVTYSHCPVLVVK